MATDQETKDRLELLVSRLSHDLRAPIRQVWQFSGLLEESLGDRLSDGERADMSFVRRAAERMLTMLEAMSRYAHTSPDRVDPRPVALSELLSCSPTEVTLAADLPVLTVDREQFTWLWMELTTNATKFGAGACEVGAESVNGSVRLTIADDGIGVPNEFGESIFDFFHTLHPPGRFPGVGMGLPICRRIMENHQGRIWLDSAPREKGSNFVLELPASAVG